MTPHDTPGAAARGDASERRPVPDATGAAHEPGELPDHATEDALEPRHLIGLSEVVLRAGVLMLGAGTSSLRVRELMRRAAGALGLDRLQASISFTDITLTVSRGSIFRTQVAETTSPGVNAHRIALLQSLNSSMPEHISPNRLRRRLDEIEHTPPLYPLWLLALLVGLACSSVTVLQHGGWREVLAVFPASALAFTLLRLLARHQINHLAGVLVSAATASGTFYLFTRVIDASLGDSSSHMAAGFIGTALFLIPGFPLVTGALDLTRIDLTAGIPRIAYAGMVLIAITIGVWIVASLSGVTPGVVPPFEGALWVTWTVRILASFGAVFGWAMMFNSPVPAAMASGVIAVLGNAVRLVMLDAGVVNHIATFIGCVVIGLACALAGRLFGLEKIIMTVPTLLVVIPGSTALQTMLYFDKADTVLAMSYAIATLLGVVAMVAGLSAARMLTDPEWTFTRPDAPSLVSLVKGMGRKALGRSEPDVDEQNPSEPTRH